MLQHTLQLNTCCKHKLQTHGGRSDIFERALATPPFPPLHHLSKPLPPLLPPLHLLSGIE
jgi:hypothetical protein